MKKNDKELLIIKNGNIVGRINLNNSKNNENCDEDNSIDKDIKNDEYLKYDSIDCNDEDEFIYNKNISNEYINLYKKIIGNILDTKSTNNMHDDFLSQIINNINTNKFEKSCSSDKNTDKNTNDIDSENLDYKQTLSLDEDLKFNIVSNDDNISYNDIYTIDELLGNLSFLEVFSDQVLSQLNKKIELLSLENKSLTLSYEDYKNGIHFKDLEKTLTPKEQELFDTIKSIKKQQLIGGSSLEAILDKLFYNINIDSSTLKNDTIMSNEIDIDSIEYLLESIYKSSFDMLNKLGEYKKLF